MPKFIFMPPQDDLKREWALRLSDSMPEYEVVSAETEDDARREIVDAEAAFGWIPPDALLLARKLKWLQNPDTGPFAGYFYPELIEHPVTVCNPRGIYSDHISHHVMMYILGLSRGLPYYFDAQRSSTWNQDARQAKYLFLPESTVLISGVGGVGHETAQLCHAFGMRVLGVEPRPEHDVPFVEMHDTYELDELLPQADFVVSTTPHTPETVGMWNINRFKLMKPTAYFISTGRGKTTVLEDLTMAIEQGQIAGCGLDVYEIEPLPADHRLWKLPNVILTPHIAVRDAENLPERRYQMILENARRFATGRPLQNVVDKERWY